MVDNKVRAWLIRELPGLVEAESPAAVLRKAWGLSGIECSVGDFTDALWRAGFRPDRLKYRCR